MICKGCNNELAIVKQYNDSKTENGYTAAYSVVDLQCMDGNCSIGKKAEISYTIRRLRVNTSVAENKISCCGTDIAILRGDVVQVLDPRTYYCSTGRGVVYRCRTCGKLYSLAF